MRTLDEAIQAAEKAGLDGDEDQLNIAIWLQDLKQLRQAQESLLSKDEMEILSYVQNCNTLGYLAGLGYSLSEMPSLRNKREARAKAIYSLARKGKIIWKSWTPEKGAGWEVAK